MHRLCHMTLYMMVRISHLFDIYGLYLQIC